MKFHKQEAGVPICGAPIEEAVDYGHNVTCRDCLTLLAKARKEAT